MGKMRSLVLESGTWRYRVGRQYVKLRDPAGKSAVVLCSKLLDVVDYEEGGYAVKPSDVRRYIEHKLLGISEPAAPAAPTQAGIMKDMLLHMFVRYSELLRRAFHNPSHEQWQQDVRDFEQEHVSKLEPLWRAWQARATS